MSRSFSAAEVIVILTFASLALIAITLLRLTILEHSALLSLATDVLAVVLILASASVFIFADARALKDLPHQFTWRTSLTFASWFVSLFLIVPSLRRSPAAVLIVALITISPRLVYVINQIKF